MEPTTFDLNKLADAAGVTTRTIRYYLAQGLLPSPATRGPGTRYDRGHLDRLQLTKRLQRQHLPLAEIRRQLESLNDAGVREALRSAPEPAKLEEPAASVSPRQAKRSTWDRVALSPDVELHVRRPLTRAQNRQVEQLLEAARHIFAEEP